MGIVSEFFKNKSAQAWRDAGSDKAKRRDVRKSAYGNTNRTSKRIK